MCEILFRGKKQHDGEWVYGWYREDCDAKPEIISSKDYCSYYINSETVGQFTGGVEFSRNEENETLGRNIFEGDIVQISSGYSKSTGNFLIFWNDEISGFSWKHLSGKQKFFDEEIVGMKIIGNRWDNPELLGGAV